MQFLLHHGTLKMLKLIKILSKIHVNQATRPEAAQPIYVRCVKNVTISVVASASGVYFQSHTTTRTQPTVNSYPHPVGTGVTHLAGQIGRRTRATFQRVISSALPYVAHIALQWSILAINVNYRRHYFQYNSVKHISAPCSSNN